jgi:RNA-directed DNA polymerase
MSLALTTSPQELSAAFFALKTRKDVASLLDIEEKRLIYHLYISPLSKRYKVFEVPKKSGSGCRKICTPDSALKIIQHKLNQVLQSVL